MPSKWLQWNPDLSSKKIRIVAPEDCDSVGFFVDPHSVSWIKKGKICLGFEEFGLLER